MAVAVLIGSTKPLGVASTVTAMRSLSTLSFVVFPRISAPS
jgi:hypothetical protein